MSKCPNIMYQIVAQNMFYIPTLINPCLYNILEGQVLVRSPWSFRHGCVGS